MSVHSDVDGYVLGTLDERQSAAVAAHLAECERCRAEVASLREVQQALRSVPPEILLDGPPPDGDLLLQRTIRQVRAESRALRRRRAAVTTVAAVVVAAALVSAGVLLGRAGPAAPEPVAQPPASSAPAATPPGTRFASVTDPGTGASLTVAVMPAAGWVRVHATVTGIPAGERCRLIVSGTGGEAIAGGWLVSDTGATEGTALDGSALLDPGSVTAVRVENTEGKVFAMATL